MSTATELSPAQRIIRAIVAVEPEPTTPEHPYSRISQEQGEYIASLFVGEPSLFRQLDDGPGGFAGHYYNGIEGEESKGYDSWHWKLRQARNSCSLFFAIISGEIEYTPPDKEDQRLIDNYSTSSARRTHMATTNNKLGSPVGEEGRSVYIGAPGEPEGDRARFIVTLSVGYGGHLNDGVETPLDAAAAALALTLDGGSEGTVWFVFDRETGEHHLFEQGDFEERMHELGLVR